MYFDSDHPRIITLKSIILKLYQVRAGWEHNNSDPLYYKISDFFCQKCTAVRCSQQILQRDSQSFKINPCSMSSPLYGQRQSNETTSFHRDHEWWCYVEHFLGYLCLLMSKMVTAQMIGAGGVFILPNGEHYRDREVSKWWIVRMTVLFLGQQCRRARQLRTLQSK